MLNESIEREKLEHSQYSRYLVLAKTYKAKKDEYDYICAQLSDMEASLQDAPKKMLAAIDGNEVSANYMCEIDFLLGKLG
ncbi:hypothetical protein CYL18_07560 [Pradoshia eiseniae]|uniref:Uncharacterized protein n=1 Tax=Pradoshia eiseniae TaxID=2064768 RepID=A0A2S7N164_9BACI|nr:hypothetical protein [Pradoshia eiseniae]PQD95740.1 hypothetical protein CYL18_07560 [Pradoshia eiseniae]